MVKLLLVNYCIDDESSLENYFRAAGDTDDDVDDAELGFVIVVNDSAL